MSNPRLIPISASGHFLSAYTLSTSCLNHVGRKIAIYNPIVPVIGIIGIKEKIIRARAHLILVTIEAVFTVLSLIYYF